MAQAKLKPETAQVEPNYSPQDLWDWVHKVHTVATPIGSIDLDFTKFSFDGLKYYIGMGRQSIADTASTALAETFEENTDSDEYEKLEKAGGLVAARKIWGAYPKHKLLVAERRKVHVLARKELFESGGVPQGRGTGNRVGAVDPVTKLAREAARKDYKVSLEKLGVPLETFTKLSPSEQAEDLDDFIATAKFDYIESAKATMARQSAGDDAAQAALKAKLKARGIKL